MPHFDDEKQREAMDALRAQEEEELAQTLSVKYGVRYIDLTRHAINVEALRIVKEVDARASGLAVFDHVDKHLSVAVKSPVLDATREMLQKLTERGYTPTIYMVSMQSLERAWSRYAELASATEVHAGLLDISADIIQKTLATLTSLPEVRTAIEKILSLEKIHRTSSIVEIILGGALSIKASDVHVEPEEHTVRLRYRLDGVLTDILNFDRETYALLTSRIKLISGLKLNVKNEAQDGRFSIRVRESDIEIRTSVLPGAYGESVVMRILDPSTIKLSMEKLGIEPKLYQILETEIRRPNGMLLNTGPTGSGKTTTLYAFLRKIHTPDIKIVTLEDPIEYHLEGIVQTQVDHKHYTFAGGLRSTLRQDPDVIMVGEIRDGEVATTAINAALTGHFVFSTLHTNNAAGAFPRLLDLGVNPKVVGSAVTVVMAQRLIRRLKPDCRREVKLEGEQKRAVEKILDGIVDKSLIPKNVDTIYEPLEEGTCEVSFAGRLGVFEVILMDKELEKLVAAGGSERDIASQVRRQELLTMAEDGILKVLQGTTSLSELARVLDVPELSMLRGEMTP
jgi:type II secretory ATPase GspE/PulE/Tfp pilus assembly ATPase PilB-like protein